MDNHEKEQERRKQKALERLGTNTPACVLCGESDWQCLELHHIAGQAYDESLAIVCHNCHRKVSNIQKDHPKATGTPPDPMECIGQFLIGLADLFELLVKKLREFGQILIVHASAKVSVAEVRS